MVVIRHPKKSDYPAWLYDLVFPEMGNNRAISSGERFEKRMRFIKALADKSRFDDNSDIILTLIIEGIRTDFQMSHLQRQVSTLFQMNAELRESIELLKVSDNAPKRKKK